MIPTMSFPRTVSLLLGLEWRAALAEWMAPETHGPLGLWGRRVAAVGVSALGLGVAFEMAAMTIPAGVMVLGLLAARAPIHRMPGFWPLLALFAWALLSAAISPIEDPLGGLGYLYVAMVLPCCCCALVASQWALRWTTIGACTGLVLHAVLATLQFTVGMDKDAFLQIDPDGRRFYYAPGWRERNVGPAMYAGALALIAWHSRSGSLAPRWLQWLARMAGLAAVIMTKARSAMLGLCVALVAAFARSWRRALVAAVIALLLGGGALGLLYVREPERVERTLRFEDPRVLYWRLGVHDIHADPLFGRGGQRAFRDGVEDRWREVNPGQYFQAVIKYNLHNTPLNYTAFHGIPAGLFHLLFLAALGIASWRAARHGGLAFSAWSYMIVCGMFDATWTNQTTAYPMALMLALCLTASPTEAAAQGEDAGLQA